MLFLRELNELEPFASVATLVAGKEALDNRVSHITVLDVPVPHWDIEEEFILSTFFSIKDDIDIQIERIRLLSEKGVAALGIKVNRYIDSIHPSLLEVADELSLPIFAISKDAKFRDLIRTVSQVLINRQNESYRETIMFQDKILTLSLKGASPEILRQEIEKHVGYRCAILSTDRELITGNLVDSVHEEYRGQSGAPYSEIDAVLDEMALNHQILDESSIEYRHESYVVVGGYSKGKLISIIVFSGVQTWGVRESIIAKYAANIIGMNFLETYLQAHVEKKMLGSFVDDIVFKGMEKVALTERASFFGWKIHDCFQVIVAKVVDEKCLTQDAFQLLANRLARQIRFLFPAALTVTNNTELVILVSLPMDSKLNDLAYHKAKMNELLADYSSHSSFEKRIRIGVGSIFNDVKSFPVSYRQAFSLVEFAANKEGLIWYAADHLLELFLMHSKEQIEHKQIRNIIVDRLAAHDRANGTELLKSLNVFLHRDSLEEASEVLYIHPNTLRNRLGKVFEITGINPYKTSGRLFFLTALIGI